MRIRITSSLLTGVVLLSGQATFAQGTAVKDGTRTYRFTVDYNNANGKGEIVGRSRIAGEYTCATAGGDVVWRNVTQAEADGAAGPFRPPQKHEFMEGFRYPRDVAGTLKPGFFKGFPPTAVFERSLVWDTAMTEQFGHDSFEHLKLNEPYHFLSGQNVNMPDVGAFHNRDVVLGRIGRSQRNGRECALIQYQAFFNPIEIVNGGMNLKGRSDYWRQIWVSPATRQIEYATLYESVIGEMKPPGQDTTQFINVFRSGVFEPLSGK